MIILIFLKEGGDFHVGKLESEIIIIDLALKAGHNGISCQDSRKFYMCSGAGTDRYYGATPNRRHDNGRFLKRPVSYYYEYPDLAKFLYFYNVHERVCFIIYYTNNNDTSLESGTCKKFSKNIF